VELEAELLVGGFDEAALPHAGGGVDEVVETDEGLGLAVYGFNVVGVKFLGLFAVEECEFVLFQGEVAGRDVAVDYLLSKEWYTLSRS
jgi:hypothetical protein